MEVYVKMRMKTKNWHSLTKDLEIIKVTNFEEIETIRPIWEEMQSNEPYPVINAEIDRYISIIKAHGEEVQPYIILIKHNGNPISMIIGRLERRRLNLRLGYKTLLNPTLRCLSVVYGGIIGKATRDIHVLQIRQLMEILRNGEVDMVFFNQLRVDSQIYQLARTMPGFMCRNHFPRISPHWTMSVPKDIESFYQARSKKHRGNIRRSIRNLEREYRDRVEVVNCNGKSGLDDAIKAAHQVSFTTYQHGLACGFVNNSRTRTLMTTAGKQGWLRFAVLFIDGKPCAFQTGLYYQGTYLLQQIAFDPRWSKFNIGTILFVKVLEHICADPDIQYIDFGFGDADYKRSYGDTLWQEASVCIFALRPYPIFINMLQAFVSGLNSGLEYVLNKTALKDWIKKRWRNLLQQINTKGQGRIFRGRS